MPASATRERSGDNVPMGRSNDTHTRPSRTAVAIYTAFVLVGLACLAGCALRPVPTVDDLAANYRTNRSDFDRLRELTPPDADFEFELHEYDLSGEGIDPRDVDQFAGPLKAVGAEKLRAGGGGLMVLLGETGMVSSGFEWGYVYSSDVPSGTVSIEVARDPGERELWYYPLGDGWYAYSMCW